MVWDEKSKATLKEEIQYLLLLGYEGGYWDYKADYPAYSEDKLHDIICMANNLENRDAYLIYGVNNDGTVVGIENTSSGRMTSKSIIEFLRGKDFAGGYIPKTEVVTLRIDNHEIDVLIIHNSNKTPYFLQSDFGKSMGEADYNKSNQKTGGKGETKKKKTVRGGVIYTRTEDINTPMEKSASLEHIEYLWRKRFGYDKEPFDRFLMMLDDMSGWSEPDWDIKKYMYYRLHPEFQIKAEESGKSFWDSLSFFYDDCEMLFAPLKLHYLNTVLYETQIWYMDMGRCIIPAPNHKAVGYTRYHYYYFEKDTVNGKLLKLFTNSFECKDRNGLCVPVLIFEGESERLDYEKMFGYTELIDSINIKLKNDAIHQHRLAEEERKYNGKPTSGVNEIAISYELYKKWLQQRDI